MEASEVEDGGGRAAWGGEGGAILDLLSISRSGRCAGLLTHDMARGYGGLTTLE